MKPNEKPLMERVTAILLQFRNEELGNRLSQFAMSALIAAVAEEIRRDSDNDPIVQKERG